MSEARAQHDAAIRMARELGDRRLECSAINGLGSRGVRRRSHGRSVAALRAARLTLARETGDRRMQGGVLGNLANVHTKLGRTG